MSRMTADDIVKALMAIPDRDPKADRPLIFFATPSIFHNDAAVDMLLSMYPGVTIWKQQLIPVNGG